MRAFFDQYPALARLLIPGTILVIYFVTHILGLTALPVFADESIYIRWAQLITHDNAYWFFSMNDGKPPLFIWALLLPLQTFADPLFAARFLSVLVGAVQLFFMDRLVVAWHGGWRARVTASIIIISAPFWFFHHRMGLMDSLLTLSLSISLLGLTYLHQQLLKSKQFFSAKIGAAALLAGIGFGLSLLTKTPALFFSPVFLLFTYGAPLSEDTTFPFSAQQKNQIAHWLIKRTLWFGLSGAVGFGIFALLRVHPAFGTLFSRSSDFTYTLAEFLERSGQPLIDNTLRAIEWLSRYMRPELISLTAMSLVGSRQWKRHSLLFLSLACMIGPFLLLGKTVHPRYLLPSALFITLSASLFLEECWDRLSELKQNQQEIQLVALLLIAFYGIGASRFMLLSIHTPDQIPFVIADRAQYLTEWSSGHGLTQVRDSLITAVHSGKRVTVVTEGSFGTLPDGLLMYFDTKPEIASLRIEGLGQFPVRTIPDWVYEEAAHHDTWLVVNEDRQALNPEHLENVSLLARYPRPYGAADLQVYQIHPRE